MILISKHRKEKVNQKPCIKVILKTFKYTAKAKQ